MTEHQQFIQWAFYALITGCAIYLVAILDNLNKYVKVLSEQMGMIIEKTAWHEKELDDHNGRLRNLEVKRFK